MDFGYTRSLTKYPVPYPSAGDPQAWSTGAPLLLLRTIMGLQPYGEHLTVDPAIPSGFGRVELLDVLTGAMAGQIACRADRQAKTADGVAWAWHGSPGWGRRSAR